MLLIGDKKGLRSCKHVSVTDLHYSVLDVHARGTYMYMYIPILLNVDSLGLCFCSRMVYVYVCSTICVAHCIQISIHVVYM